MKRNLHDSPNLAPVDEYEPWELGVPWPPGWQPCAHIEYMIDDGDNSIVGFCTSEDAFLQVLRRNAGKWVRARYGAPREER